jgi:hypothetical protein
LRDRTVPGPDHHQQLGQENPPLDVRGVLPDLTLQFLQACRQIAGAKELF